MKQLPFCAVCGRKEVFHDSKILKNWCNHEFVPCVSLKEAEEAIEKLELELARTKEKVRENVRD